MPTISRTDGECDNDILSATPAGRQRPIMRPMRPEGALSQLLLLVPPTSANS